MRYQDGHYNLVKLNDEEYQGKLKIQSDYWDKLKIEIEAVRNKGYENTDIAYALNLLKTRVAECKEGFPHEIGVFLDYPLGDVIGFIENKGHNYKCKGCWKVYCNECEAQKTFQRYQKCRNVYLRLWKQGRSVLQLTVAV